MGEDAVPISQLFEKVPTLATRFIEDDTKLVRKGDSKACDLLAVGHYMQAAVSSLLQAVRKGGVQSSRERNICPISSWSSIAGCG